MNIFHTILQKIGIEKPAAAAAPAPAPAPAPASAPVRPMASSAPAPAPAPAPVKPATPPPAINPSTFTPAAVGFSAPSTAPSAPAHPAPVAMVDVLAKLEGLAKSHPGLDWKVSIVDLLKLLDMDSSSDARKELAKELNCPANEMADSARMNVWLHKTVLQKIAENGGNIPDSLLH